MSRQGYLWTQKCRHTGHMNAPSPYGTANQEAAAALAALLERRGMSKAELSRRSGISRSALTHYLAGEAEITLGVIQRIVDTLDFPLSAVLTLKKPGE